MHTIIHFSVYLRNDGSLQPELLRQLISSEPRRVQPQWTSPEACSYTDRVTEDLQSRKTHRCLNMNSLNFYQ